MSRNSTLTKRFKDKQYRDGFVAAHTRNVLAGQIRNLRGNMSQEEFGAKIGKKKTMVARLENPAYAGISLRTMLIVARSLDIAVFVRFVTPEAFIELSGDLSDEAMMLGTDKT